MPAAGLGSADGRLVLTWNREGTERAWMRALRHRQRQAALAISRHLRRRSRLAQCAAAGRRPDSRGVSSLRHGQAARSDRQHLGHSDQRRRMARADRAGLLSDAAVPARSACTSSGPRPPLRGPISTTFRPARAARILAARSRWPATASSTCKPARPRFGMSKSSGWTRSRHCRWARSRSTRPTCRWPRRLREDYAAGHRGGAAAVGQKAVAPVHRQSGQRFCRRHDPQVSKAGRRPRACHGRLGRPESVSGLGSLRRELPGSTEPRIAS